MSRGGNIMNCIVFDLDGTLFDTASVGVGALRQAIEHCIYKLNVGIDIPTNERIRNSFGLAPNIFYQNLINPWSQLTEDLVHQESLKRQRKLLAKGYGALFPQIMDMLRYITNKGCRIYIASNGSKQYLEMIKENAFNGCRIENWFSCDGDSITKAEVLCSLQTGAQENIIAMVGDRKDDALAARSAGVKFIWCEYGYEYIKMSPGFYDITVHSPSELFRAIKKITN